MDSIIFAAISIGLVATVFQGFTLLRLFNAIWIFAIALYFFGPLQYKSITESSQWFLYLLMWMLSFNISYLSIRSLIRSTPSKQINDKRLFAIFSKLGVVGSTFWVAGGLIYSLPYIISLDFYSLRISFVGGEGDISLLSKLGSILAGFVFFIITRKYYENSSATLLQSTSIVLLLLVPIFMAGRQLYLQMLLIVSFSLLLSAYLKSKNRILKSILVDIIRNRFTIFLLFMAMMGSVAMTLLRLGGADLLLYGSRLELYVATSSVELKSEYKEIFQSIPNSIQDLVIEFTYYFSAQIAKFSEFYSLNDGIALLNLGIFEKSLFIKANIEKLGGLLGYPQIFEPSRLDAFLGYMPASAWGTVVQSNIYLYGSIGACLINMICGFICALSQAAVSRRSVNYYSYNFYVANCVLIFYSISESVLNEIYFLIYYLVSLLCFLRRVDFVYGHFGEPIQIRKSQIARV